jgi:hypothetical protein
MVEDAVHRGLESGDHGTICHEFVYYDLELKYASERSIPPRARVIGK